MISKVKVRADRKELEERYHGGVTEWPTGVPKPQSFSGWLWIICTPHLNVDRQVWGKCEGPFFHVHDRSLEDLGLSLGGQKYSVCPHIVEID